MIAALAASSVRLAAIAGCLAVVGVLAISASPRIMHTSLGLVALGSILVSFVVLRERDPVAGTLPFLFPVASLLVLGLWLFTSAHMLACLLLLLLLGAGVNWRRVLRLMVRVRRTLQGLAFPVERALNKDLAVRVATWSVVFLFMSVLLIPIRSFFGVSINSDNVPLAGAAESPFSILRVVLAPLTFLGVLAGALFVWALSTSSTANESEGEESEEREREQGPG